MAEERDRTKRYANPPKGAKKHGGDTEAKETGAAKSEAEKTAGGTNAPHTSDPDKVGKVGKDPGPEGGHDSTWGVVATRHKREHGDMMKRHGEEAAAMHERHGSEAKTMHARHSKEMQDEMEKGAEGKAEASAGTPKELGGDKGEGKKGAEV